MTSDSQSFSYSAPLLLFGITATLSAVLTGMCILMISVGPLSLLAFLMPHILLWAFAQGCIFAFPVTFGVLPIAAVLFRRHPVVGQLSLPFIGAFGGWTVMWLWLKLGMLEPRGTVAFEIVTTTGLIAGFVAGAVYGRAFRELRR